MWKQLIANYFTDWYSYKSSCFNNIIFKTSDLVPDPQSHTFHKICEVDSSIYPWYLGYVRCLGKLGLKTKCRRSYYLSSLYAEYFIYQVNKVFPDKSNNYHYLQSARHSFSKTRTLPCFKRKKKQKSKW